MGMRVDMLLTGSGVPLGTELAGVPQAPSDANNAKLISFAKSFGEVAVRTEKIVGGASSIQLPKETLEKTVTGEANPVGSVDTLHKTPQSGGTKVTELLGNVNVTKSVPPDAQFTQPAKLEKPTTTVPLVIDEASIDPVPFRNEINGSARAACPIEKATESIEDSTGEKLSPSMNVDFTEQATLPKSMQSSLATAGQQPIVQKKEIVGTATSGLEKTAKYDVKGKGHSGAASVDKKQHSLGLTNGTGDQMAVILPTNGVASVAMKVQETDSASDDDSRVAAAQSGWFEIPGGKASKKSQLDMDRIAVTKSVLDGPKDEKEVTAKAIDQFAQVKKGDTPSAKTVAEMMSATKWIGERSSNDGTVALLGTHEIPAMPASITAAVTEKSHASTTGVPMANQHGVEMNTTSITDSHRMLEATPTALEVGVSNGTHGWLKIRAEMADGGVVNASVSATTSAGQEMLHRELPSLAAYLHEERIGAGSVVLHANTTVEPPEPSGGMNSDAGSQQMQGRGDEERESRHDPMVPVNSDSGEGPLQRGLKGAMEIEGTTARAIYGGNWLSVRA